MQEMAQEMEGMPMQGIASLPMEPAESPEPNLNSGIAGAVSQLQAMGRNGDTVIAHLTPDEIVVPGDILRQKPEIKEMIFAEMRLAGVEDPERFIVGSDANFVNPESGLPEFFLKNIIKGVRNTLKKVAPIVLPLALHSMGLGAIASGALGAGIGTLAQGGKLKDAFKNALIGGAVGGLAQGIQGGIQGAAATPGRGGFYQGFQKGISQAGTDFMNTMGMGQTVPYSTVGETVKPSMASQVRESATVVTPDQSQYAGALDPRYGGNVEKMFPTSTTNISPTPALTDADLYSQAYAPEVTGSADLYSMGSTTTPGATVQTGAGGVTAYEPKGFVESLQEGNFREAFLPSGPNAQQIALARETAYKQAYQQSMQLPGMTPEIAAAEATKAATAATADMGPTMLRSYGPLAAVGTGIAGAAGFFDTPEPDEPRDMYSGKRYSDMTAEEKANYQIANLTGGPAYTAPYMVPYQATRTDQYSMPTYFRPQPVTYAATGGEMINFPRRNGAISGPGTETSDDVPAMLSDGEFVMTAKAVRGAGHGDRQAGVKTMHNLMKAFEMGVA